MNQIAEQAMALNVMGIAFPTLESHTLEGGLNAFRGSVRDGQAQLEDLNRRVQVVRHRLKRLGYSEGQNEAPEAFSGLQDARSELQRVEAQVERARAQRLGQASEAAQRLYRGLVQGNDAPDHKLPPAVRELRELGLVRTVEEDS